MSLSMFRSVAILFCLFIHLIAMGQSSEIGITLGTSTYKGDLKTTMFTTKYNHLAGGVLFRHSNSNHWSYKVALHAGRISAADSTSKSDIQKYRNLSFRSNWQELNLQTEFNFFKFQTANPTSTYTPFLALGLTLFHFNPQALLNDEWVDLQPLATEGQGTSQFGDRKKYKRLQVALAFGGGFKFRLSRRFGLVVESGVRRTFTDYLDDVSTTYADKKILAATYGTDAALLSDRSVNQGNNQNMLRDRGNRNDKDWYVFTGVQLTYTISKKYNDVCKPFRIKFK
ncbi:MAG: hypothetical protein JNK61_09190 [Bacteroidia bacterium]|nr:hypothetical protein [Bacteroidia bacterium]